MRLVQMRKAHSKNYDGLEQRWRRCYAYEHHWDSDSAKGCSDAITVTITMSITCKVDLNTRISVRAIEPHRYTISRAR